MDQPDYYYYECPVCGFDRVLRATAVIFDKPMLCPLCAEDCGHDQRMDRRVAREEDRPEGKDERGA